MLIHAGFGFALRCPAQTSMLLQLNVDPSRQAELSSTDVITFRSPTRLDVLSRSFHQWHGQFRRSFGPCYIFEPLDDL